MASHSRRLTKNTPRILLVEDDNILAGMYKKKFQLAGMKLDHAKDGSEALKRVRRKYQLILLDILLPHHDGFEVLTNIRASRENASTPVFLLTNLSDVETVARARLLNIQAYLIKAHVTPLEIVTKVLKILEPV
ncbi:MAG: response regulator [Patescibacteria group bacterium]